MILTRLAKVSAFLRHLEVVTGGEKVVPLFLMNSEKYGGSAAPYAAMSVGAPDEVGVHEIGHSFASLRDEYVAESDPCFLIQAWGGINISTAVKRDEIRWKHWIEDATPVPTPNEDRFQGKIGFFQGAASCKTQLYRPAQTCKMRNHYDDFCAVCKEAVILKLYETIRATRSTEIQVEQLAGTKRTYRFSVATLRPGVKTRWWLDGKFAWESTLDAPLELELTPGRHQVVVQAQDPTSAVRSNRCALAASLTASVDVR